MINENQWGSPPLTDQKKKDQKEQGKHFLAFLVLIMAVIIN